MKDIFSLLASISYFSILLRYYFLRVRAKLTNFKFVFIFMLIFTVMDLAAY